MTGREGRTYAITNTKLVLEDGILWDGAITYRDGKILQVGAKGEISIPQDAEVLDARGLYTAPGLVDIHNHGCKHVYFSQEPEICSQHFLRHGETTVLPTFYCIMTLEEMLEGARRIREASRQGAGRIMDGLYMEGPYMCGRGSNQNRILWTGEIRREEYIPLLEGLEGMVRVWAIDPEREGIEGFMKDVKRLEPQAIFALGHSIATAPQCRRLKHYGIRVQTHHGDSGKAPGFAQGTMGAGCDEFTLYDPDIYAELICDENGIHVAPDLLKMVVRTKGVERIILISDSMPAEGDYTNNEAEGIAYGPDLNYDYEGHLAGSHLTLDCACRNLMKHTGYGLCHAIRFASLNPARMLGIDDQVGSLERGKKANLIVIDDMVHVKSVILEGETFFSEI
ncbi:MAG: N-acetylglucosamine-6-phosphate deacetylase [Lachnospiraceae bacterium]|jgi:N-acetylglucosamine-6-phosphate deacetylase|nr:N-acetylglucosamine-6-phosphate deacetylase [Lachnospiraceae bacterium]MCI9135552.1 N-acetylglucosamine-6-phosphate deacetylase [Lachnospiraceae bacterium]